MYDIETISGPGDCDNGDGVGYSLPCSALARLTGFDISFDVPKHALPEIVPPNDLQCFLEGPVLEVSWASVKTRVR